MKGDEVLSKKFASKTIHDIVTKYSSTLLRIAFQNTKSLSDAEDIVQNVFIKLINHRSSFVSEEHLKAWLIRVTINQSKDLLKSAWYRTTTELNDQMDLFTSEDKEVLRELFLLKKFDRNIIYLYYYEGYKIKEIASILNKNENTISSSLQRARKKLKKIITEGEINNEQQVL